MPGWSRVMPTTFEESERAAKRQKRNTLHPHLTFTPGDHQLGNNASVGGNDDHPAIAQIEAPPTNPVQVLSRLANIRTFCTSTHSSVFSNLALNAIGLIETDHDCVKALNRTCAILRGDDLSWLPPEKTDPLPVSRFPPTDDDETEQRPSSSTSAQAAAQANPAPAQESPSKVEAEEPDILLSNSANHSSSLQDAQPEAGPSSNGPHLPNGSGPSKRESSPSALERSLQLQKLIDPATAVESLFVSPTPVAVPSSGSTAIVSLNEQKLLLHAGLIELSRFLADCLEYQARLREISDLVHGVDRRRKGLYTIIKRFVSAASCLLLLPHPD